MSSPGRKWPFLFDWPLFLNLMILLALGLLNLYSATASSAGELSPYFRSQILWAGIGMAALFFMLTFHYRHWQKWSLALYLVNIFLLVLVIVMGTSVGGQKNWLVLGPVRLQPSELAKFSVILMLARHFAKNPWPERIGGKSIATALGILFLPLFFILWERDLGAAIFFVLIGLSFFYWVGVKKRFLAVVLILLGLCGAVGYQYVLKDYQRARIQTFLNPEQDPRGRGYHILQSKIAVGSGEWTGKGYLDGSLNKLKFLPERHTDFVFPVLAEEWGFWGSLTVLLAFTSFFLLLLQAAGKVQDTFGRLVIAGITAWLFWQWALNLGGVLGLLPLAGVTLPFFSYGGSALLTNLLALGLVLNIYMRRYVF